MRRQYPGVMSLVWRFAPVFVLLAPMTVVHPTAARAEDVTLPDVYGFSAISGPDGQPWAVWSADDGRDTDITYSRWTEQGWLPAEPVFRNPAAWDDFPSMAFDAHGTPWIVWSSGDREQTRLVISHWTGSRWSDPEQVPTGPATRPQQPALAAVPDGGLALAWIGFDGNDDEIYASFWNDMAWLPAQQVGRNDADPMAYDTHPRLVVEESGSAWLVWVSSEGLFDDVIVASHWDGKSWSKEQAVSAPDDTPDDWPSLVLDADGQPWLAWQGVAGSGADARWRIYVARWQADDNAWTLEELASSAAGLPIDEQEPQLAFDETGKPYLAWNVSGAFTGLAYTTWDGTAWSSHIQTTEGIDPEAAALLAADPARFVWVEPAGADVMVVEQQDLSTDMGALPRTYPQSGAIIQEHAIVNRYVCWGDSITWGQYDDPEGSGILVGDYPARLDQKLDTKVVASEVFNFGAPGEKTNQLKDRIGGEASAYLPQYPLVMEGTNDISSARPPNAVASDLAIIIDILKRYSGVDGIRPWLSTVIPRLDSLNYETQVLNEYIRSTAATKGVPYSDNWQAFINYGDWPSLFRDSKHPNKTGMQILADNWYQGILNAYYWLYEETTPPTTWVEPLPAQSPCGAVTVQWSGSDNLSWVTDYDVQAHVNYGAWTDWLVGTAATGAAYESAVYGTVGFRVRGRDVVGNQSDYSDPVYTLTSDDGPPYEAVIEPLPAVQRVPFQVRWSGADACSPVRFDVQYAIGTAGVWQTWVSGVSYTSAIFSPTWPLSYGQRYYFRVVVRDQAGNWIASAPVSTLMARYILTGQAVNVRHEPIVGANFVVTSALGLDSMPAGYVAYLADPGDYDVGASRIDFGTLPPMHVRSVERDRDGLDFVLPPLDDVVGNGGFETAGWAGWDTGGTLPPTQPMTGGHTGDGMALVGGTGGTSWLSQTLSVPAGRADATLSFLAWLDGSTGSSSVRVELQGAGIDQAVSVPAGGWVHVSLPANAAIGQDVLLVLSVSDQEAVYLDEVSLGSAQYGGSLLHLPSIQRNSSP